MNKVKQEKGFTLIEVIIVIAIIAVLAAIAIPAYHSYTVRSAAADIIVKHEELQSLIYANATDETSSCSDLLREITPDFLEDNYASLSIDFAAVKDGYSPVLTICADFDKHGKLGIEASKEAHERFADMNIDSPPGSGKVLGDSMVTYSVTLAVDDAYLCTDYQPDHAIGKVCGSKAQAPQQTQPAPPPDPSPAPAQAITPDSTPKFTDVTITEKPTKDTCPKGYVFVPDNGKAFDGTPQTGDCKEASKYQDDPYASVECAVCTGPPQICERLYEMTTCEYPDNICVSILKNSELGSRTVVRRCGNRDDGHEWYYGYSDNDRCTTLDLKFVYTLDFECTYACTSDRCNESMNPVLTHHDSMWTPP